MKTLSWLAGVSLLLALGACSKKTEPAPDPKASAPAVKTPPPPGFDRVAAAAKIAAHVWEGTVSGKPALFIAKARDGRIAGGLEIGKTQRGVQVRLEADRRIFIQTGARPVAGGVSYLSLSGKLDEGLTEINGTVEQVVKQGFVEQASGAGDFRLKRGISRAELAKKKAVERAEKPPKAEPEAKP
jgi:hypothetical protein